MTATPRCHYCGETSPFRLGECQDRNCDVRREDMTTDTSPEAVDRAVARLEKAITTHCNDDRSEVQTEMRARYIERWNAMTDAKECLRALSAENERLRKALEPCLSLLDGLVKESGRGIDWGEEDPFRMGEWFEDEDIAAIETARAAL